MLKFAVICTDRWTERQTDQNLFQSEARVEVIIKHISSVAEYSCRMLFKTGRLQ